METVTDFILGGSKITVDSDYSHKIKRHLLLGMKAMTNLDSLFKKQTHHFALSEFQEIVKDRKVWRAAVRGITKGWTLCMMSLVF